MTRRNVVLVLATLAAAAGLDACRKKPEPEPMPTAPASAIDNGAANQRRADSVAAANQRRADSLAAARAAARNTGDADRTRSELVNTLSQKVYFDYDQDALRDDARSVLDAKAAILSANSGITIVITGHTDERGTAEYNLALGQRRAAQVKRYLESRGVAEARIVAQSLGDSQPAAQGTDEAAYQQNRRAEFEARNVTGTLNRPRT